MMKCYRVEFKVDHPVVKRCRFNGVSDSPKMAVLSALKKANQTGYLVTEFVDIKVICPVHFVPKYPVKCGQEIKNFIKINLN